MESYEILTGVGLIYIAPVGESFPDVDEAPAGNWRSLGTTQDGVTVALEQSIEKIRVDQKTGAVKAVRAEEDMIITTKLAEHTLENLADLLGVDVTDTAPGASTIGTREVPTYRGGAVDEFAFLFRGESQSPYGASYPSQFEIPRGFFSESTELEFVKDNNAPIPIEVHALVDLSASAGDEFGKLIAQDAAATG